MLYIPDDEEPNDLSCIPDSEELKKEPMMIKPLHSIDDIVGEKDNSISKKDSKLDRLRNDMSKSAFQFQSTRNFSGLDFWRHHQMFLPGMYSLPFSSAYDHVTSRRSSSALTFRSQGDMRFCSS
ncbi:hypothetical protein ACF0H5_013894 [Mactra antiquata]